MVIQKVRSEDLVEDIFEQYILNNPRFTQPEDLVNLRKAFEIARQVHKGTTRKTGEPYIYHPIEVAKILTDEIGLGVTSAIVALLHEVTEVSDYNIENIENQFGTRVADILRGLSKIPKETTDNPAYQSEKFRRLLLSLAVDVRVILIKFADQLHNMRTIQVLPHETRLKKASEILYMYAPLAHRLGMNLIKNEFEDLSFKILLPEKYEEINHKVKKSEKKRNHLINRFAISIGAKLDKLDFKAEISGRTKSIYSIYRKMESKKVPFEEVYDLLAVRIVFEPKQGIREDLQCWNIYTLIAEDYKIMDERIRDWVSRPKENGYEALHLTATGTDNEWFEVQIRTKRMHEIAERGYAAHWKYKGIDSEESSFDKWIKKTKDALENPNANALDLLDEFKVNEQFNIKEILVFTPKGEIISLPQGSTVLDFAFSIHSDLGYHCIGAQISRKIVKINHVLKSGDQVQILTLNTQKPSPEWLNFLVTDKAINTLKTAFKESQKKLIDSGKEALFGKFKELSISPNNDILKKLLKTFSVKHKRDLYAQIGKGVINFDELVKILKESTRINLIRYWRIELAKNTYTINHKKMKIGVDLHKGLPELNCFIANCCSPLPGDEIVGIQIERYPTMVHKSQCPYIRLCQNENEKIPLSWITFKQESTLQRIKVHGNNKGGTINRLTELISNEFNFKLKNVSFSGENGVFEAIVDLYVPNEQEKNRLLVILKKIKGITSVSIVEDF